MVGRGGRDGAPSETVLLASPSDATAVRRFATGDIPSPDDLRRVYRAVRDAGGTVDPEQLPAGDHDPRVLVGMLEQAGIVRRGYDAGRAMRIELLAVDAGAGAVVDDLLVRYAREAEARVERIVRFAESRPLPARAGRRALRRDPAPGRAVPVTSAIRRPRARRPPQ